MKITYDGKTIDFFDRGYPTEILLTVSGGLDSASLFYLICKHFPKTTIIPYVGRDKYVIHDSICSSNIVQWMKNEFPHVDISDLLALEYDQYDPKLLKVAKDNWTPQFSTHITGYVKTKEIERYKKTLQDMYPDAINVTGMSTNPPISEMEKHGFLDVAERRRDIPDGEVLPQWKSDRHYEPWRNVNKKFIADIYRQHNLMDSLYPLTNSCIHVRDPFKGGACGWCFWCKERAWAFTDLLKVDHD